MTLHPVALRAPRFVLSMEKAPEVCVKDQLVTEWTPVIFYNIHSAKRSFTGANCVRLVKIGGKTEICLTKVPFLSHSACRHPWSAIE